VGARQGADPTVLGLRRCRPSGTCQTAMTIRDAQRRIARMRQLLGVSGSFAAPVELGVPAQRSTASCSAANSGEAAIASSLHRQRLDAGFVPGRRR